ncbi:hypothetical protein AVEN_137394-1 [Araneus ventricosus]|uniref:Uncharacterized protein n=1 Tax=Araneus ventricosus TaxID=182803 RepID=A0A4Y2AKD7_ARAVE|nr:hypothetical protein AVEN_137394-1 [Araneus ventricosus]
MSLTSIIIKSPLTDPWLQRAKRGSLVLSQKRFIKSKALLLRPDIISSHRTRPQLRGTMVGTQSPGIARLNHYFPHPQSPGNRSNPTQPCPSRILQNDTRATAGRPPIIFTFTPKEITITSRNQNS